MNLPAVDFPTLLWLFVLAITLHMVEEVIWLPAWSQEAGRWHEPVTTKEFALATAVLLAFIWTITIFGKQPPFPNTCLYLAAGMAVVFLINIIHPHIGATLTQRRYSPGLLTALLLNLPVMGLFLWRFFDIGHISKGYFVLATLLCLLAAAFLWPLLFRVGRYFFRLSRS